MGIIVEDRIYNENVSDDHNEPVLADLIEDDIIVRNTLIFI